MAHKLGTRSKAVYDTLHPDLQRVIDIALEHCTTDFSLITGHRTVDTQFELFKKGREFIKGRWKVVNKKQVVTNIDGHLVKGNHNYEPSRAFDFTVYIVNKPELTWDKPHLSYIAATFMGYAHILYDKGEITHKLRWGGDWDSDGDQTDQKLIDMPHLELIKP